MRSLRNSNCQLAVTDIMWANDERNRDYFHRDTILYQTREETKGLGLPTRHLLFASRTAKLERKYGDNKGYNLK